MSRTDQVARLLHEELERVRAQIDGGGQLRSVRLCVRFSDGTGAPFAVSCSVESERRLPRMFGGRME